jgi:hypothetical protein
MRLMLAAVMTVTVYGLLCPNSYANAVTVERTAANKDLVAVHWKGVGTNSAAAAGMPGDGKKLSLEGMTFFASGRAQTLRMPPALSLALPHRFWRVRGVIRFTLSKRLADEAPESPTWAGFRSDQSRQTRPTMVYEPQH